MYALLVFKPLIQTHSSSYILGEQDFDKVLAINFLSFSLSSEGDWRGVTLNFDELGRIGAKGA
jgi:hypothetical protein